MFSASGIGFGISVGWGPVPENAGNKKAQQKQPPKPKYHDIYYVDQNERTQFGPVDKYVTPMPTGGRGSPNSSEKCPS